MEHAEATNKPRGSTRPSTPKRRRFVARGSTPRGLNEAGRGGEAPPGVDIGKVPRGETQTSTSDVSGMDLNQNLPLSPSETIEPPSPPDPPAEKKQAYRDPRTGKFVRDYTPGAVSVRSNKGMQYRTKQRISLEDRVKAAARRKNSDYSDFDPLEFLAEYAVTNDSRRITTSQRIHCAEVLASFMYAKKRRIEHVEKDFDSIGIEVTILDPKELTDGVVSLDSLRDELEWDKEEDEDSLPVDINAINKDSELKNQSGLPGDKGKDEAPKFKGSKTYDITNIDEVSGNDGDDATNIDDPSENWGFYDGEDDFDDTDDEYDDIGERD